MELSEKALDLLNDLNDDWYGLWEVDWYFNGRHPEWPHEKRTAFFSDLVHRGLIELFHGPLWTKRPPLDPAAAVQALADPAVWAPPNDDDAPGYYVTTSPIGIAATQAAAS